MSDNTSVMDLLYTVQQWLLKIWKYKFIVLIFGVVCAAFFIYKSLNDTKVYDGKLTFMVNDDEGSSMGGVSAILGQFGLGSSGGGKFNYQKISQIALSDKIIKEVLTDSAEINDSNKPIASHLIEVYDLKNEWEGIEELEGFAFDNKENDAYLVGLKKLIGLIRGDVTDVNSPKIVQISQNEESAVLTILTTSESEELSIAIAKSLYDKLQNFYVSQSIARQQRTYDKLTEKADSIYNLLVANESALARGKDRAIGLVLATDRLPTARSTRNIQMYGEMYAEVIKNKETAHFLLQNATPVFQVIDVPFKPLPYRKSSLIVEAIKGGVIGCFIASVLVILIGVFIEVRRNLQTYEAS